MIQYICDRCGSYASLSGDLMQDTREEQEPILAKQDKNGSLSKRDICHSCRDSFKAWYIEEMVKQNKEKYNI